MRAAKSLAVIGRRSAIVALAVACSAVTLHAGSILDASNWSASGPGVPITVQNLSGQLEFTYYDNPAGFSLVTWTFTSTAAADETVKFQWNHSGNYSFFNVTEFVEAFVYGPGGETTFPLNAAGPQNCCTPPSGGFNYSGTVTLTLHQGYTYGFEVGGSNGDSSNLLGGTFTLLEEQSNSVPEPSSLALFLAASLAVLGFRRFKKNRSSNR